jgi:hypothetical protein
MTLNLPPGLAEALAEVWPVFAALAAACAVTLGTMVIADDLPGGGQ